MEDQELRVNLVDIRLSQNTEDVKGKEEKEGGGNPEFPVALLLGVAWSY